MYLEVGKLVASSLLLLGLGITMVGISNNPDRETARTGTTNEISDSTRNQDTLGISETGRNESEMNLEEVSSQQQSSPRA